MKTGFTLKDNKGDGLTIANQFIILLATTRLLVGNNEDYIHSEKKFDEFMAFLTLLQNNIKGLKTKDKEELYTNIFDNLNKQKLNKNIKGLTSEKREQVYKDFFSIVDSFQDTPFVIFVDILFMLGVFGLVISSFIIGCQIYKEKNFQFLISTSGYRIINYMILSLIFLVFGKFMSRVYHGKSKSLYFRIHLLVNVPCCYKRLTELQTLLIKNFNLDFEKKITGDYSNPDDLSIPFTARVHKENPTLPANIINVFIEENILVLNTATNCFKVNDLQNAITYFCEKCPKIKTKEFIEYFENVNKPHQVDNNNLKRKSNGAIKGSCREEIERNTKKCNDFVSRINNKCDEYKIKKP